MASSAVVPSVLEFVSNLTHYSKFPVTRFMFVLSPLPFLLATSPLSLLCDYLHAVRMLSSCHPFLTAPFTSSLDAPSGLPR